MPWVYRLNPPSLEYHGLVREVVATDTYSGFGPGKNNPATQNQPGVGPIPVGAYLVGSVVEDDPLSTDRHGPVALHLIPQTGDQIYSRSGFLIHGDSIEHPGQASHGCIIAPRPVRERIRDSHDKLLLVTL